MLRPASTLLLLPLLLVACSPEPDELREQARAALEAGEPSRTLALLERIEAPSVDDRVLRVEAELVAQRFDDARVAWTELPDDHPEREPLQHDLCAGGAMDALANEDPERAAVFLDLCETFDALDLHVLRLHARAFAEAPDFREFNHWLRRLRRAPPGQSTDVAAEHLERLALRTAERFADDPEQRLNWLGAAWRVGREEALAERIIADALTEGEARVESDPQLAITLFEFILFERIEGFQEADDAARSRAEAGTERAAGPIILETFLQRFERRAGRRQAAEGVYDPETRRVTLDLTGGEPEQVFSTWFYTSFERRRPEVAADLLDAFGLCPERDAVCTFDIADAVTAFLRLDAVEAAAYEEHVARAAANGGDPEDSLAEGSAEPPPSDPAP